MNTSENLQETRIRGYESGIIEEDEYDEDNLRMLSDDELLQLRDAADTVGNDSDVEKVDQILEERE